MVGQTLSHYKVLEKLGEGGMGEVFLAQDTSLDRKVALKFLPNFMQEDPTAQKRFLREAKSAAALDHPFICNIHEVGEENGKSFISMKYVQGETLREKLAQSAFSLKDALEKATEIAEALEAAHICVAFVKLVKQLAKPAVLWSMGKGFALFGFSQTLRSGHDLFLSAEFFSDRT